MSKASRSPLKLAVLLSGGGTTMLNIQEKIQAGELNAEIVCVISSKLKAKGVERAKALGLSTHVIRKRDYTTASSYEHAMWNTIKHAEAELVVMAGFLSLLTIVDDYRGKVMNIHPALLPSFGGQGMHGHLAHQAVLDYGAKISGCTVHFADDQYDTGPIIIQKTCAVHDTDTADDLAERVMAEERKAYPEAIQLFADDRLTVDGRVVKIKTK